MLIFLCDEVDGNTTVAKTSGPSYAMQVSLCVLWEVKVYHHVDRDDVDAACKEIGRN